MFGKDNKKKELVNNLGDIYARIEREHQISPGDFPNLRKMQVSSGILANIQGNSIGVTAGNTTEPCRHWLLPPVGKACCNVEMYLKISAGYIWAWALLTHRAHVRHYSFTFISDIFAWIALYSKWFLLFFFFFNSRFHLQIFQA